MNFRLIVCTLVAVMIADLPTAFAQAAESDISRSELFAINQRMTPKGTDRAIAKRFKFPDHVRDDADWGIDYSHHNCECVLDWSEIANQRVAFVYLKASEGATWKDPWFTGNVDAILKQPTLEVGAYHFYSASLPAADQAGNFLAALGERKMSLPASLDLEWNLGPARDDCPANAIIERQMKDGSIKLYCDQWAQLKDDEIIARVNIWIDAVEASTGVKPTVYTLAKWWNARVGSGKRLSELHTTAIWIADWSRKGLAEEVPVVPSRAKWTFWQFTDQATVSVGGKTLLFDGSLRKKP